MDAQKEIWPHNAHPQSLDIISLANVNSLFDFFLVAGKYHTNWQPAKWNWPICRAAIGATNPVFVRSIDLHMHINSYEERKINKLQFIWNILQIVHTAR